MEGQADVANIVQFLPFNSLVDPSFWHKLSQVKLDIQQLSDEPQTIWGSYSSAGVQSATLQVNCSSFNEKFEALYGDLPAHGRLLNTNTIESFKECDKMDLLNKEGELLWGDIIEGAALSNPSLLNRFLLLSFADLKKYRFYYWFAFLAPSGIQWVPSQKPCSIITCYTGEKVKAIANKYLEISDVNLRTYFIVSENDDGSISILPLSELPALFKDEERRKCLMIGFTDPSSDPKYPGWPLRNLLALFLYYCPYMVGASNRFLGLRLNRNSSGSTTIDATSSMIFTIRCDTPLNVNDVRWLGWERNDRNKFGARMADISSAADPTKLAESALSLNLKLIKWRLVPDLDLHIMKDSRCLLMGAGTLGCIVARTLLAWGVRRITFVDNGTVSYSNPARQSLFTFEDSVKSRSKSEAAAEALKKIYPMEDSRGVRINIPMPGHTVGPSLMEETKSDVEVLDSLVREHDLIFLLTDSRESRWLPAVLAAVYGKLAFTAALGFDSYLVLRHGKRLDASAPDSDETALSEDLACYFCNDVTAPGNSQRDRTLDQQCTVTRPGVSSVAGALVVELAMSVLQEYRDCRASGDDGTADENPSASNKPLKNGRLGTIPHSVRGYLSSWQQILPKTERFQQCIACSDIIISEYRTRGFDFVLDALNSGKYLEDLTGLTEMHKEIDLEEVWELSGSEDEFTAPGTSG